MFYCFDLCFFCELVNTSILFRSQQCIKWYPTWSDSRICQKLAVSKCRWICVYTILNLIYIYIYIYIYIEREREREREIDWLIRELSGIIKGKSKFKFKFKFKKLLVNKRITHHAHLTQPSEKKALFCLIRRDLQCMLQEILNNRWTNLAERKHLCADTRNTRGFYDVSKVLYESTYRLESTIFSADGQMAPKIECPS